MPTPMPSIQCIRLFLAALLLGLSSSPGVAQVGGQPVGEELRIRQIFVPEAELKTPLQRDREGVVLGAREFSQLVAAARKELQARAGTHGEVIVQQASYVAQVDGDRLIAELIVDLDNSTGSWGQAAIQLGGWQIERAQLVVGEAAPATPLLSRSGPTVQVFLAAPGRQQLRLDVSLPLQAVGGDKAAEIDLTGAPSGEFAIEIPAGRNLLLEGSELPRPAPLTDATTYVLPTGGWAKLSLLITDRKQTSRSDVLTFASTSYGVNVAPGEVTWQARTHVQVFGRPIDQLICTVPASLEITDVESEGLEAWELADAADDRTMITLRYRQPFEGGRRIQFRGLVSSRPDAPWTVPNLVLSGVTSHVGTLVVSHPSGVRLQAVEARGVRAVMNIPLEDGLVAPGNHLMYQVWDEQFALSFATSAKQQQVRAAMTNVLDIHRNWFDLFTTVNLESRFAPLFEARIQIPAGWMIVAVLENGAAANWSVVPGNEGAMEVRIPLASPLNPGETREISLTSMHQPDVWPVGATPQQFALPEVRLPQAGMVEALYGIVADEAFEVIPQSIVGLDPARQDDLNSLNQRLIGIGKQVRLGYAYQDTVFSGSLDIVRKPASLVAGTMTFARLDPDTLFAWLEARLEVSGGGVRELQFSVAEAAGTDLRFEVIPLSPQAQSEASFVRIVEQEASDPVDGMRTWTLKLDRYLVGVAKLRAVVQMPRDPAAAEVTIPQWNVMNSERQSGFIAVEAADDQRVRVTAKSADGTALRNVDPIDFPKATYQPRERVVSACQHLRPGWQVTIAAEHFERSPIPTAVGHHLQLTSIVSGTGEVQHAAELRFTGIGVQSMLVRLPEAANLWSTLLDGRPVEVRRTGKGYQVPLPSDDANAQRRLTLVYATTAPPLSRGGEFHSQPPTFALVAGGGVEQPLEVLEQEWDLSTPRTALLFDSQGLFEPTQRLDRGAISGALEDLLRLPDWSRFATSTVAIALVLIVLAGLRMLLIRVSSRWRWLVLGGLVLVVTPATYLMILVPSGVQMPGTAVSSYENPTDALSIASKAEGRAPSAGAMGFGDGYQSELGALSDLELEATPAEMWDEQRRPSRRQELLDAVPAQAPGQAGGFGGGGEMDRNFSRPGQASSERGLGANRHGSGTINGATTQPMGPPPTHMNDPFGAPPAPVNATAAATEETLSLEVQQSQQTDSPVAHPAVLTSRFDEGRSRDMANGRNSGGGLLSMTVQLQEPDNMRTHRFAYRGNGTGGGIQVQYADQRACQMLMLCIAAGVVLFGWWWMRKATWMLRSLWLLVTIAIPWALAPVVPITGQLILEAVLCGGLVTAALWVVCACLTQCHRCCSQICCCLSRCCPMWRRTAGLWLVLGVLTGVVQAEDIQAPVPQRVTSEPYVIIPYAPGQDPLTADRIFVPHDLHQRLWKSAHPEEQETGPDLAASVVEALYAAKLVREGEASRIEVQGRLTLVKSRPDRETVALPFHHVIIRKIEIDGQTAAVDATKDLRVSVEATGLHTVDVVFDVPVRFNGPAGEFRLKLDPVPAASLVFEVPDKMKVGGSGTYRRLPVEDGLTRILTPVDRGGLVTVNWQPESQQQSTTGTIAVETAVAVLVDDSGLSVNHAFRVTPRQEAIQELSFSITPGAAVRRISGQDVGGWEMDEAGISLKVFLRRPVSEPTVLSIDLFQNLSLDEKAAAVAIPQVAPVGVTTETGLIGVFAGEQFVLRNAASTGVSQLDNSAFKPQAVPAESQGSPLLTYRYVMRPFQLNLLMGRRPPESRAVAEHGVSIQHRKMMVASRVVFELTGAPRPSVSVELPDNYLPIDVAAPQLSDWYITTQDDRRILTIELAQPYLGSLPVVLEGRLTRDPENADVIVELPVPADVSRLDSSLGLWLNEGESGVIRADGAWRSIDPGDLPGTLRQLDSTLPQFAFRSSQLVPPPVELTLQSSLPELQADAVTLVAVTEATIDYGFTFRWAISRAAADTFQFTGPDWLAGRLEINAPGLREIVETELPESRRLWTVHIVEPVRDLYLLTAVATIPVPENQRLLTPLIQFQQGTAEAGELLEFQRQYAILVNLSTAQLVPVDPAQAESVARDQLPLIVSEQLLQQAMEIDRVRPQRIPAWQLQRVESSQDAAATVTGADLLSVIQSDGSWRTRAAYSLRNRGRQFLALRLPEGSRLLSVLVANRPARAVTTTLPSGGVHLVALPQTSEADLSFEIRLILAGELASSLPGGTGLRSRLVTVPVPQIVSPKESAEFGLTVAQTTWNVHFPDDFLVSPVNDVRQTNMTWNRGQQAWLTSELNRLSALKADAMEMIRISKDSSASISRRSQAASNLKQIGQTLQRFSVSGESSQLVESNRELFEQVEKNLDFDGEGIPQAVELQAEGAVDQLGREYILDNNGRLFSSNLSGKQFNTEGDSRAGFNYREQGLAEFGTAQDKKAAAKGAEVSRARLKSQLQGQGRIVGNTLNSDLGALGEVVPNSGPADGLFYNVTGQQGGRATYPIPEATLNVNEFASAPAEGEMPGPGQQAASRPAAWSTAGGLSLDLEIPVNGQSFSFSKVGGDPRLAFVAQPRGMTQLIKGGMWGVVWLLLGLWACHWLARLNGLRSAIRILAMVVCVGSLLGFLLLEPERAWTCFVLFGFGGFVLVVSDPLLSTSSTSA